MLLVAAVVLTYLGSLDGGFVSDDVVAIRDNPLLRSLAPGNLVAIFSSFDDANYIPLKVLSLAIDQRLFGPEPFGYHLTNLVLHALCALLVRRILLALGLSAGAALLTALLWALHPLQVESVAFMSERKNVLSALFFFAAFLAYARFARTARRRDWAVVMLLFVLALLSKMNTVVLPALCIAYDWVYRGRIGRRTAAATLPLFAVGALVVWYNLAGNATHGTTWHGGSPLVTWLSSSTVVFRYLAAVVAPFELRTFYYVPLRGSLTDPPVALSLLGLALLAGVTAWLVARRRREGFWLLWFGITLAPMLNIVPFPTLMQDRYMYLPLLGVLAAAATALDTGCRRAGVRRALAAGAGAAALAGALLSVRQIETWHDPHSLWTRWALLEWYLPADSTRRRGAEGDAQLAVLEAAARARPESVIARHNLGAMRLERGDLAGALVELEAAERLDSTHGVVLLNLGRAHYRMGDAARAAAVLERAVASEPYSFFAQLTLARARLALGDRTGAGAALDAAARARPGERFRHLMRAEREQLEAMPPSAP